MMRSEPAGRTCTAVLRRVQQLTNTASRGDDQPRRIRDLDVVFSIMVSAQYTFADRSVVYET